MTPRPRLTLALAVTAIALVASAVAVAKPDKTATLGASSPEFKWDGEQGNYSFFTLSPLIVFDPNNCSKDSDSYCEQILLDVRSGVPVKLDASLTEFSSAAADFDLYVYKSDASGTIGEQVDGGSGTGGPSGQDEVFTASEVEPGYYLLVAVHFYNPGATYKGAVKVTGATPVAGGTTPPPATTPPATTPPPAGGGASASLPFKVPATLGSAKKAKKKKALSFKATASADITNLTLALLDSKKKVVARAKFASFKKGSRTVKLKVKKLKKGTYTLAATGTVAGESLQVAQVVKVRA